VFSSPISSKSHGGSRILLHKLFLIKRELIVKKIGIALIFVFIISIAGSSAVNASIIITEILADPASGEKGDANNDGQTSSTKDEFVEIFNSGQNQVNMSGWILRDSIKPRHMFREDTLLLPQKYLVIFGGGEPNLSGIDWKVASTGGLGLNNGGDVVSLLNKSGELVDRVSYGSVGGHNQSIVRFPELTGQDFILHTEASENPGKLFSPGEMAKEFSTVPEVGTIFFLLSGLLGFGLMKRRF